MSLRHSTAELLSCRSVAVQSTSTFSLFSRHASLLSARIQRNHKSLVFSTKNTQHKEYHIDKHNLDFEINSTTVGAVEFSEFSMGELSKPFGF